MKIATSVITIESQPYESFVWPELLAEHLRLTDVPTGGLHGYIDAAFRLFERKTGRSVLAHTLQFNMDRFPEGSETIYLPRGPVSEVTQLKYLDSDGQWVTMDAETYTADVGHQPARLAPVDAWPATKRMLGAVAITYSAGHATHSDMPGDVRQAIIMLAALLYENPEGYAPVDLKAVPMSIQTVIEQYRMPEVAP